MKRNAEEAGKSRNETTDLVLYQGETGDPREEPAAREPVTLEEAKREVAEALKEIWELPESQRSSAIKRLIRRWHPDKNKHRESFANVVTKFLLNEVERLKKGGVPGYQASTDKPNQPSQRRSTGTPRGSSGRPCGGTSRSSWNPPDFEEFFDRYRTRHGRRQARARHHNWQEADNEEEPANENEARRWMRQSREDLETADCLIQKRRFAFACFHCQQAVEKALKALMFAKGRLKKSDLEAHDILTLAYRASGMDQSLRGVPNMVATIHGYYIKTRYPQYQRGLNQNTIPAEMYSHADAENATSKGEEILQLIQQVLN